jgi:hypothetical protein
MTQSNQRQDGQGGGIIRRLHAAWTRELALLILRGVAALLAVIAGALLIDLLADWTLDLPGWLRVVLLLANVLAIGWAGWIWLRPCLRRFVALHMALRVERENPQLESLLVSAVQFHDAEAAPGASDQLMRAVERVAESKTRDVNFNDVTRVPHLAILLIAAVLTVGGLTAVGVAAPGFLPTLMTRLFDPSSKAMYPTRTRIEVVSGNPTILQGSPVELAAVTSGENPRRGKVLVNVGGAGWEELHVTGDEDNRFAHRVEQVVNDTEYYFQLGDARSHVHKVTVARPPRIIEARVRREFPAYTVDDGLGQETDEVRALNQKVPQGTKITWRLRTDRPVSEARLVFEEGERVQADVGSDGRSLTVTAEADASLSYRFAMDWKLADKTHTQESAKHFVTIVPDMPPRVAMTYPLGDQQATLKKLLSVTFFAADDYGLDKAWLVYQINDGPEKRREVATFDAADQVEKTVEWKVAETLADLREGDLLTYRIEVADARPGGGDKSRQRSSSRQIQFVSPEEYLAYAMGRRMRYLSQIRPVYNQQREAAKAIRDLVPPAMDAPPASAETDTSQPNDPDLREPTS